MVQVRLCDEQMLAVGHGHVGITNTSHNREDFVMGNHIFFKNKAGQAAG